MNEFVLYSSVYGGYERIWQPINQPRDLQILLSDEFLLNANRVEPGNPAPNPVKLARLANRRHKMLFFTNLDAEGFSVYVDANVRPVQSLMPLFAAFADSGADLGLYRHYARNSVRDEALACLARNKVDNPEAVDEELALYRDAGFPDTEGMWEGSVIFKRHDSPRLSAAMEEWWELYSRFQTRDQFSLPFVIWKHDLQVYDLDLHSPGREHYFVRLQHSQRGWRNRAARYLQARAPENWFWKQLHNLARSLGSI